MEKELVHQIKIKTAIALNKLLYQVKTTPIDSQFEIARSHGQIAASVFMRKATVTNIFNAKTNPGTASLILIIQAMGFTIVDFAHHYESVTAQEIIQFKRNNGIVIEK